MAGDFSKRTRTDNKNLQSMVSAQFKYLDGAVTTPIVVCATACYLIRVTLNTNGAILNIKSGSRPIANIASDAPEGDFDYGVYCENGLTVQAGAAGDWTVVWDK